MSYETKQSRLVDEFLKSHNSKHFSAEDVYFSLVSKGERIGRTTVYRQLDRLVENGKARKFFVGENEACCYQYNDADHCHNHYHLKCSGCGALIHTECEFLDKLASHIFSDHQFTLDGSKTVLYGTCKACAKENS